LKSFFQIVLDFDSGASIGDMSICNFHFSMKALQKKFIAVSVIALAASGIAYAAPVGITFDGGDGNDGTGSTSVAVTASVAPILSLDVSTGALALGALTSAGYSSQSLDIELATNAIGGATVTAASVNGALVGSGTNHQLNDVDATLTGQSYRIGSVADAGTADLRTGSVRTDLALEEIINTTAKNIYVVNGPERADGTADAVVTVQAKADDATPADSYSDSIVITVTAQF
jgi:hypothetical protein